LQRGEHVFDQIHSESRGRTPNVTDRRPIWGNGEPGSPHATERLREEQRLLERYHRDGDLSAREELVTRFLPLARQLVRRFERPGENVDDLMQVASLGLVKAVDRYEPERGFAFSSFAVPTILGELKRYFRDSGWAVHVPRALQERALEVNRSIGELSRGLGRSPNPSEVAAATGLGQEVVLEAIEAGMAYDSVSLEAPPPGSDKPDLEPHAEHLAVEERGYELAEYTATLAPQLRTLPDRDRMVLHLRFAEDLTQSEIAERIGVSQMHVSRLIRGALERLREGVGE
jgi:RNA polymerase sigma-B factor